MSSEHTVHGVIHEPLDPELIHRNARLAVWLGLVSFTFFIATAVASNVYLRKWSPDKFTLQLAESPKEMLWLSIIVLLVCGILLLLAGGFFRADKWRSFNVAMSLITLCFFAYGLLQIWFIRFLVQQTPQIWTAYVGIAAIQVLLAAVSIILLIWAAFYTGFKNKQRLRAWVPVVMNVWLYTVIVGIVVIFLTDLMTVSEFADYCGVKLKQLIR
ncbi:hypothetical protein DNHGIG_22360 [Collibacillus ludicampi]|uniref:Uncharacterized protein n=1 Tax=Collibacillus ludicampi TaxID=2771369 RepID=A0AAV4LFV6_9BACL|nr:hypothetical protein [Collibacillus ludicampi]GIM46687.1 hypothetical protein DNHGIG_22360 [Collibacillus ludicampi]